MHVHGFSTIAFHVIRYVPQVVLTQRIPNKWRFNFHQIFLFLNLKTLLYFINPLFIQKENILLNIFFPIDG